MESFQDECGLVAVAGHHEAAHRVCLGLHALAHRGGAGASVVAVDGATLRAGRGSGNARDALDPGALAALKGRIAMGQVWSRAPERLVVGRTAHGQVAVALSGRFSNGERLRAELGERGAVFTNGTDAEVLLHGIARSTQSTFVNRVVDALWKTEGAFAALVCTEDLLLAARDPRGFRPLALGQVDGATVVASEDSVITSMGGRFFRDVRPGEMVILDAATVQSVQPFARQAAAACIREFVSLAAARSDMFGYAVYPIRVGLGERLGREQPTPDCDLVMGLPHAQGCALGYAKAVAKPFREGLVAIAEPGPGWMGGDDPRLTGPVAAVPAVVREFAVVLVVPAMSTGREVAVAVSKLKEAGARAVHLRVASPPTLAACPFGVAGPSTDEMLYPATSGLIELTRRVGADSVAYLSVEGMHAVVGKRTDGQRLYCDACFTGDYPVPPEEPEDQLTLSFDLTPP